MGTSGGKSEGEENVLALASFRNLFQLSNGEKEKK
jgi:hypothetical protein